MTTENAAPVSTWSPLAVPRFRAFWIGMSLSTTAFWMQNIAVTWLMRDWTDGDPVMISLVQTALFLPVMLLSLPAGTIADMFDRRKFLIFSQIWMSLAPLAIAALAVLEIRSPMALLACTVLLAIGNSMKLPSQSALLPSLVDKDHLPFAISLNSMAVNGGRIIGPAFAGALLPIIGAMALFLANSGIYLLYVLILMGFPPVAKKSVGDKPSFVKGLIDLRAWVQATSSYSAILLRGGLYFCVWSTVLAIVPLIAKDAAEFGTLYGLFGFGAIAGASLYGSLSKVAARSTAVTGAILLHALCIGLLSIAGSFAVMAALMAVIGVASFFIMTTFQVSAQLQLPDAIRGRGLALMTTVFMGATALSSPVWGFIAEAQSASSALQIASGFSILCALAFAQRKIEP
ncbi:MAG: MFS transporter [Alphaproteobacteria bacterium]|nr:MFS transporter [Alphaproteobacteria bacterium]